MVFEIKDRFKQDGELNLWEGGENFTREKSALLIQGLKAYFSVTEKVGGSS